MSFMYIYILISILCRQLSFPDYEDSTFGLQYSTSLPVGVNRILDSYMGI